MKRVRTIEFRGNHALDTKTLRAAIATQQAPFLYRLGLTRWIGLADAPVLDALELRRDVLRLQALYGVRGFPQAQIDTLLRRRGNDLAITFRIDEGAPIVVDSIRVAGLDTLDRLPDLRKLLPLHTGAPFDRIAFQASASVLETWLRNRGHAFARVTGGFEASAEDPPRSVRVTFSAEPGPRARIGTIDVEGTEGVDDRVVLKTLRIEPGDVYSDSALHEGMVRLQRTDLFRQISVRLVDTAPPNAADTLVDVRIRARLAEYPLRRARVSAGYGTLDCFRSMATVDLFNFTGHGRRLELRGRTAQLGVGRPTDWGLERGPCPMLADEDTSRLKLNYNLAATLHEPLLAWERTTGMVTLYAERHTEFGAYLREAVGGELALTYALRPRTELRGSYSLAHGRTIATPATFCALLAVCLLEDQEIFRDRRRRSIVAVGFSRDRTNSLVDATSGSVLVAELRWSPALLGSDRFVRFTRLTSGFKSHIPLGANGRAAGRVFSWRVMSGILFAPTEQLVSGARRYAPPEERLYAGGSTTVRGFSENRLGPVVHVLEPDSSIATSATGGTVMAVANAELRVPMTLLGLRMFGAVFVDGGLVGDRGHVGLDDWRMTPGMGLRIPSFLGPIRLDLGLNPYAAQAGPLYQLAGTELQLVQNDFRPRLRFIDRLRLHLAIGQAF